MNLEQDALDKKNEFEGYKKELEDVRGKFTKSEEDMTKFKEELDEAEADKADATALGLGPEEWEKVNKRYEEVKAKFDQATADNADYAEFVKELEFDYERTKADSEAAETDRATGEATNGKHDLPAESD